MHFVVSNKKIKIMKRCIELKIMRRRNHAIRTQVFGPYYHSEIFYEERSSKCYNNNSISLL